MSSKPQAAKRLSQIVTILAFITLVAAYAGGIFLKQQNDQKLIGEHFPNEVLSKLDQGQDVYSLKDSAQAPIKAYVVIKTIDGWGGPARVGVQFSLKGKVERVVVLSHLETPVFFRHLVEQGFFRQFQGKNTQAPFEVGQDVDAISGATVSSKAFTKACGLASFDLGKYVLNQNINPRAVPWQFGLPEMGLLLLLAATGICIFRKWLKARKYILGVSAVFVGFYMAAPIAISNIGSLLLGYLPPLANHIFWWSLMGFALLSPLALGKNHYCMWLCPFGGLQEIIFSIAGFKIKLNPKVLRIAAWVPLILLWVSLIIIFLSSNPSLGMFEPFASLFSFKGSAVQWYLVSLTVFAAFLMPRFWCRFFCPVGAFLNRLVKLHKKTAAWLKEKRSCQTK